MKLRKGMLGALLGVTFATTLLSTSIVHAENNYTSTVGNVAVRTIRDDENMIGWKKINNQWYYLDSAGNYVKGWINVDGKQYYLKADGTRATNTIIGDYIFGNEGVGYQGKNENGKFYFADGWYYNFSDKKVYYPNHTSLKVGVDGKVYADERRVTFDSQGVLQSNWFGINRLWYSLNLSGKALTGWQKIDDHWYYFNEFGAPHIGWLKLNDNWYYFDKYTGIMHTYMMFTGTPIITTGETYYFDPKTGAMQTGWVTYESGDKYYFYSDGRMARNTKIGEYTINNYGRAYIENYTGWQKRYDDWTYSENGKKVTGWKFINNNWYYFDVYGKMSTVLVSPVPMHGGGWYLLDSSGAMKTGWQKYNGEWCYFGSSGNMYMGWQKIDGKWYYFGSSKNMPESMTVNDKGVWYKYNISGAMKTGWQKISGVWYYFDASGAMKTGWLDEGGKKYYLQSSGAMATNTTIDGYKIDASGVATKVIQNGWQSADNHWYYYTNGTKVTGWKAVNNVWYYFDGSGVMKTGWQKVNGVWYYFNPSGAMQKGWQKIDGAWYYFGTSGAMKTGWLDYAGQKYYLKSTGAMATNTTVDGYKIDAYGVATKVIQNGWQSADNHWYYYTNGTKVTGWKAVNNIWYYFDGSGVMKTGWQKVNGVWYYFNPSGAMQKGWQKIDGAWYYFDASGAMKTGWLDYAGQKYYLQSSGAMATNTTIDGYSIDANGVATLNDSTENNSTVVQSETKSIVNNENEAKAFRSEFNRLINEFRAENGLSPIRATILLTRAADIRSNDEKNGLKSIYETGSAASDWDHYRPDGSRFFNAVEQAESEGYNLDSQGNLIYETTQKALNENIALNYQSEFSDGKEMANQVFTQWKNSSGHRANMLSSGITVYGLGFYGDTENYGGYITYTFIGGYTISSYSSVIQYLS